MDTIVLIFALILSVWAISLQILAIIEAYFDGLRYAKISMRTRISYSGTKAFVIAIIACIAWGIFYYLTH